MDIIHRHVFYITRRFGDWILFPSSGGAYSYGPSIKSQSLSAEDGGRIQSPKRRVFK
jgi:hypothetical protein